jgi:hypothetical protein
LRKNVALAWAVNIEIASLSNAFKRHLTMKTKKGQENTTMAAISSENANKGV